MGGDTGFRKIICHHIRCGHLRAAGAEMVAAALVLLCSGMLLMGMNMSELHHIGVAMQHSYRALLRIGDVDSNILASELSMRSYAATGEDEYFARYNARMNTLDIALRDLSVELSDQPEEAEPLRQLQLFVAGRRKMFADLVARHPTKTHPATEVVMGANVIRDRIGSGKILTLMRAKELQRVTERQRASEHKAEQTFILSSGIVVVSFGLGLLGLFFSGSVGSVPRVDAGEMILSDSGDVSVTNTAVPITKL